MLLSKSVLRGYIELASIYCSVILLDQFINVHIATICCLCRLGLSAVILVVLSVLREEG